MATVVENLLTAEEFARLPDSGFREELVKGKIIRMSPPKPYHGYVCINIATCLASFVRAGDLGYVMGNDSGVITERGPDTVRGADVCFYSHQRVPKGSLPRDQYLDVAPDLVFEVLSPDDRWREALAKMAEYLNAGVQVVVIVDPKRRMIHVFEDEQPVRILSEANDLTLPSVLGEFRVAVKELLD